jgi:signal recognition particle receptor subunit beta
MIIKVIKEDVHFGGTYLDSLSGDSMVEKKKIVFLGRPEAGKTSIVKVFFEGINPKFVLDTPLPPTVGLSASSYDWMDVQVIIFDYPGQDMARMLEDSETNLRLLDQAYTVIYIIDCTRWEDDRATIDADIETITGIMKDAVLGSNLAVFCHKIDLVPALERGRFMQGLETWGISKYRTHVMFTSIAPGELHRLHDALYTVMSSASVEAKTIKQIFDKHVANLKHTLCFISNEKNAVLALAASPDFKYGLLHPLYEFFADAHSHYEAMQEGDKLDHMILSSRRRIRMDFRSLEVFIGKAQNLIIVSEDLNPITIHRMSDSITDALKAAFNSR